MTSSAQNILYQQSLDFLLGRDVAKDERRAFALNAQAAHQGHSDAVLAMGWFYLNGVGVKSDRDQARHWYRKSGEMLAECSVWPNRPRGRRFLGRFDVVYASGKGRTPALTLLAR